MEKIQDDTLNDRPDLSDINSPQTSVNLPQTPSTNENPPGKKASISPETDKQKLNALSRSTRSTQNPEFAAKHRKFLNTVHDPIKKDLNDSDNSQGSITPNFSKSSKEFPNLREMDQKKTGDLKRKSLNTTEDTTKRSDTDDESTPKRRKASGNKEPTKVVGGIDSYCWRCHKDGTVFPCDVATCKRVYHVKCVQLSEKPPPVWQCPECTTILCAENADTRSRAMSEIKVEKLCYLLKFALNRMKGHEGAEDFAEDVDPEAFPNYRDYIVNPMSLRKLEKNIAMKMYGSTEAFIADCKWLVHNCIIFNSMHSKFTTTARALGKICKQEMSEIENCVNCYENAHTRSNDTWFIEACIRRPHILIWAKLKGYPFWPAKAMGMNGEFVDARFFGAHDKSNVPLNMCYLLSKNPPVPQAGGKNRRVLEKCMAELELHIKKLRDKFGAFEYAPFKTPYDPQNEEMQIAMMLPKYDPKKSGQRKSRMTLHNEGARKAIGQGSSSPSPIDKSTGKNSSAASPSNVHTGMKEEESVETPKGSSLKSKSNMLDGTTPEPKPRLSVGISKLKKTPLTAAAKKCFALEEERSCDKCDAKVSLNWSTDNQGKSLCHSCKLSSSLQSPANEPIEKKTCSRCLTQSTVSWHRAYNGDLFCDKCKPDMPKEEENTEKQFKEQTNSSLPPDETLLAGTEEGVLIDRGAGGDCVEKKGVNNVTPQQRTSTREEDQATDSHNKVSIADKLKDKLCSIVEEVITNQLPNNETLGVPASDEDPIKEYSEMEIEKAIAGEKNMAVDINPVQTKTVHVMLHDLKNDKEIMEKINDKGTVQSNEKTDAMEIDVISESDSDGSGQVSDLTDEDSAKKKKQNNINKVVKNLKERKISTEEVNECAKNSDKEPSTLMLDDSNDESSHILIIDEGEYRSELDKKSGGKTDKNKRKSGKPAKVCSRTSSSADSSDPSSLGNKKDEPVLDEVSGQFVDKEENVTINFASDGNPRKKSRKEVRSVNLSKSLSLSVVDLSDAPSELVEIEDDDFTVTPKPTARKSFSNSIGREQKTLQALQKKAAEVGVTQALQKRAAEVGAKIGRTDSVPPPLMSLRQPAKSAVGRQVPPQSAGSPRPPALTSMRAAGPSAPPAAAAPRLASTPQAQPPSAQASLPLSARAGLGIHNAQIEHAVQKLSSQLRTVVEEILQDVSESGESTAATVKALQVEMERLQWRHRTEVAELKHNTDLIIKEMRATLEADKQRSLRDARHKYEIEKEQAIVETKKKQWCSFCHKEASLYCCWNTAYCTYQCQQSHWLKHMTTCMNKMPKEANEAVVEESAALVGNEISPPQAVAPPQPSQPAQRPAPLPPYGLHPVGQVRFYNS